MDPISLMIYVLVGLVVLAILWLIVSRLPLPRPIPEVVILVLFLIFLIYILRTFGLF